MATARAFLSSIMSGLRVSLHPSCPLDPKTTSRSQCFSCTSILRSQPSSFFRSPCQIQYSKTRPFHTSHYRAARYQHFGNRQHQRPRTRIDLIRDLFERWQARPTFYYEVGGLGLAGGGFYVYNLENVPVSGRWRFNVISPQAEEQMGQGQLQQILREYQGRVVPEWDKRAVQVRRVLDRLVPASGLLADKQWSVHVIEDEQKNAFVIPGGHVFVFTGILPVCEDDDGLATVLGHEIGHNVAHHIAVHDSPLLVGGSWPRRSHTDNQQEKMTRLNIIMLLVNGLAAFDLVPREISSVLATYVLEMPSSRKQESEADYIGLMMMAESCYNPEAAVRFWDRMHQVETKTGAPPQMLSTHPSSVNRQQQLREW